MLPFLKHKKEQGAGSVSEPIVRNHDNGSEYNPMEAAAKDLKSALESGSIQDIAAALQAAFEIADASSHREGEHI